MVPGRKIGAKVQNALPKEDSNLHQWLRTNHYLQVGAGAYKYQFQISQQAQLKLWWGSKSYLCGFEGTTLTYKLGRFMHSLIYKQQYWWLPVKNITHPQLYFSVVFSKSFIQRVCISLCNGHLELLGMIQQMF